MERPTPKERAIGLWKSFRRIEGLNPNCEITCDCVITPFLSQYCDEVLNVLKENNASEESLNYWYEVKDEVNKFMKI